PVEEERAAGGDSDAAREGESRGGDVGVVGGGAGVGWEQQADSAAAEEKEEEVQEAQGGEQEDALAPHVQARHAAPAVAMPAEPPAEERQGAIHAAGSESPGGREEKVARERGERGQIVPIAPPPCSAVDRGGDADAPEGGDRQAPVPSGGVTELPLPSGGDSVGQSSPELDAEAPPAAVDRSIPDSPMPGGGDILRMSPPEESRGASEAMSLAIDVSDCVTAPEIVEVLQECSALVLRGWALALQGYLAYPSKVKKTGGVRKKKDKKKKK
ncbi:hypothetical protein T484DRAFT_1841724, partial [Baffinella frigidus]